MIMPFCQEFAPVDNPSILIFQLQTRVQSHSIHKKNKPPHECDESILREMLRLSARSSPKPTQCLIYVSFKCCDTSVAFYIPPKLTVHFIHNNHHHCHHFDLDMSSNTISE